MGRSLGFDISKLLETNGKIKVSKMEDVSSLPQGNIVAYANFAAFPTSPSAGQIAFDTAKDIYYFWNESEWQRIDTGFDNTAPTLTTTLPSTLDLNTDGNTSTLSIVGTDANADNLSYSWDIVQGAAYYSPERGNGLPDQIASIASGYETTGNFVITPTSVASNGGNFVFRAKATDGTKIVSSSTTVSLSFQLYDFTEAYFTVSRGLNITGNAHRFGPTTSQVRSYLTGQGHSWANQYVTCHTTGYQSWTVPKSGKYKFTAKGANAGRTDQGWRGRGSLVTASFNLTQGEIITMAAGQGVPDYSGDHCNGAGGASWVCKNQSSAVSIPLIVASGAGGDTSDGQAKGNQNTTLNSSFTMTNPSGTSFTGRQTTPIYSNASNGYSSSAGNAQSGSYRASGSGSTGGGGYCSGNLIGGDRSNSTAGYGGFGGGSGGYDESGSGGGGFTGSYGQDNGSLTGHGSSYVNDTYVSDRSVSLAQSTTTWQSGTYSSQNQFQGWVKVEFVG
jgi:hypothetical protein|tara:strand:- start:2176 stop:3684 length:1509 start_codon:yes stop_codon:yes gene_type:complete